MKLSSLNSEKVIRTRLTSVNRVASFDASPVLDPDVGVPFDFVPDEGGIIVWFNDDGSLASIDAISTSMRTRLVDIYRGTAGTGRRQLNMFGFEPTTDPKRAKKQILDEHVRVYERFPAALSA